MSTAPEPASSSRFAGRTRWVTIASIVAVGFAGAVAVGANVGILDSASDSTVGVAAASDLLTPSTQVIDVVLPAETPATVATIPSAAEAREFVVDVAGTVAVSATADGVRLDRVVPAVGWTWSLAQSAPAALAVTLTDGVRTFEFAAAKAADGSVTGAVTEPLPAAAPAPGSSPGVAPGTPPPSFVDDDRFDDHGGDREDDHDDDDLGGDRDDDRKGRDDDD